MKVISHTNWSASALVIGLFVAGCTPTPPHESVARVAQLSGKWTTSVNRDTMVVTRDGTFRWGLPYSGRVSVSGTGQLVMSLRENRKWIGLMPIVVSEEIDTLRLTPGSGPRMEFHRVREVERDSASSDR